MHGKFQDWLPDGASGMGSVFSSISCHHTFATCSVRLSVQFTWTLHSTNLQIVKDGISRGFCFWPVCGSEPRVQISFHQSSIGRRVSDSSNYLLQLFGDHLSSRNFVIINCRNVVDAYMPTALGCSSRVR